MSTPSQAAELAAVHETWRLAEAVLVAQKRELDRLRWIVALTDLYLRRYGLANTSGERHEDRKERVRDLRGEIAALNGSHLVAVATTPVSDDTEGAAT